MKVDAFRNRVFQKNTELGVNPASQSPDNIASNETQLLYHPRPDLFQKFHILMQPQCLKEKNVWLRSSSE